MHLPDGFLSPAVWLSSAAVSSLIVAIAARRAGASAAAPARVAALTAFVFAGQALQFPIPGGASGHLLGGAMLTWILGPASAILAMATVFTIQAVVFHDGGLTTLGANLWNGGLVAVAVAELVRRAAGDRIPRAAAAGVSAFAGVLLGALSCTLLVAASGTAPFGPFAVAMLGTHVWIALAEGWITAAVVKTLTAAGIADPEGLRDQAPRRAPLRPTLRTLAAAAAISGVVVLSEVASSRAPDGLESAAAALGLPMEGEDAPGAARSGPSAIPVAIGGVALCAAAAFALQRAARRLFP